MFQSFITCVDHNDSRTLQSKKEVDKLHDKINNVISSLTRNRQLCTQAAINIGLPISLLDFDRVLRLAAREVNLSSLNFTCSQLLHLQKECSRLRKSVAIISQTQDYRCELKIENKKEAQNISKEDKFNTLENSKIKFHQAIQTQLAYRAKLRQFSSQSELHKKQQLLKKKAQKAKSMNRRALKIFKNHKEKEQKAMLDFNFTSPPISYRHDKAATLPSTDLPFEAPDQPYARAELNISVIRQDLLQIPKSRTAGKKLRTRCIKPREPIINRMNIDRFDEYRRKKLQILLKKQTLDKQKQDSALSKLIVKQQRLKQIQQNHLKQQSKILRKISPERIAKTQPLLSDYLVQDNQLEEKLSKQDQRRKAVLQEQVNRIREQMKTKQERRQRHRQKMLKQQDQRLNSSQSHLKNARYHRQEEDIRHELKIKQWHQQLMQKQNESKIVSYLSKLSEQQLLKSIQYLGKQQNRKKSLKFKNG